MLKEEQKQALLSNAEETAKLSAEKQIAVNERHNAERRKDIAEIRIRDNLAAIADRGEAISSLRKNLECTNKAVEDLQEAIRQGERQLGSDDQQPASPNTELHRLKREVEQYEFLITSRENEHDIARGSYTATISTLEKHVAIVEEDNEELRTALQQEGAAVTEATTKLNQLYQERLNERANAGD